MTDTPAQTKPAGPAANDQAGDQAQTWRDDFSRVLSPVFGSPQLDLVRGEGSYVWDAAGKKYLDLLAGIAVNALGHAHPAWTTAIAEQASTLGHISNFFTSPAQIGLAEKLHQILDLPAGSAVFFSNSGTEANEAAFKMARRAGGGGRPFIIAIDGAFHGRTMGSLALTAKAAYRDPFAPGVPGVVHVPSGDTQALEAAAAPKATRRRSRRPSTRTPRPCSSHPSRARSACAPTRPATSPPCVNSRRSSGPSWSSTRCSRVWHGPGRGSPTRIRRSARAGDRTSSPRRTASAAASHLGPRTQSAK